MINIIKIIGERIQKRRKELGMSQKTFAATIDISNSHLSSIENGTEVPGLLTFLAICRGLKVTPDYLINGTLHPNNISQNIIDNLSLCSIEDQKIIFQLTEYMSRRNGLIKEKKK